MTQIDSSALYSAQNSCARDALYSIACSTINAGGESVSALPDIDLAHRLQQWWENDQHQLVIEYHMQMNPAHN